MSETSTTDSPPSPHQPNFRRATINDVIPITRLLREFYEKDGNIYGIPFDYESTLVTVDDCVHNGVCLVGPTSCAGAMFAPFPYNRHYMIALVEFWYMQRKREIGIFAALVAACRAVGGHRINTSSLYPLNKAKRFYLRCGFRAVETQFLGVLR